MLNLLILQTLLLGPAHGHSLAMVSNIDQKKFYRLSMVHRIRPATMEESRLGRRIWATSESTARPVMTA
jgi:hypothetical protein